MAMITIEDARAKLPEPIGGLAKGEELVITQAGRIVAKIVGERSERREPRVPGLAKGILIVVSDDDEHLEDFAEYMPWICSWTPTR